MNEERFIKLLAALRHGLLVLLGGIEEALCIKPTTKQMRAWYKRYGPKED